MRILLTGGSGDLGTLLSIDLLAEGNEVVNIDTALPQIPGSIFIKGSILDRTSLAKATHRVNCLVHIAAWHGIHESKGTKSPEEFHDLNVTGTFNVLEAGAKEGVKKIIFISSTSVDNPNSIYGHTKILGEEMCRAYTERHDMEIIILRPRAFIPPWNRVVYRDFIEWGKWFMKGAVHINDVKQAVLKSIERLDSGKHLSEMCPVLIVDGAYEYTTKDLDKWDADGEGSTFRKYYGQYYNLVVTTGLDPARKPKLLNIEKTQVIIGYDPKYSLKNLLEELKQYGLEGPPSPF